MARVMINCPETGKPVYTHMSFEWLEFDAVTIGTRSVTCPECGQVHEWTRADCYLDDEGGG